MEETETETTTVHELLPRPTFEEWLTYGMGMEWVSPVVCDTHDGLPQTEEEIEAWDNGEDPCQFAMRVWP